MTLTEYRNKVKIFFYDEYLKFKISFKNFFVKWFVYVKNFNFRTYFFTMFNYNKIINCIIFFFFPIIFFYHFFCFLVYSIDLFLSVFLYHIFNFFSNCFFEWETYIYENAKVYRKIIVLARKYDKRFAVRALERALLMRKISVLFSKDLNEVLNFKDKRLKFLFLKYYNYLYFLYKFFWGLLKNYIREKYPIWKKKFFSFFKGILIYLIFFIRLFFRYILFFINFIFYLFTLPKKFLIFLYVNFENFLAFTRILYIIEMRKYFNNKERIIIKFVYINHSRFGAKFLATHFDAGKRIFFENNFIELPNPSFFMTFNLFFFSLNFRIAYWYHRYIKKDHFFEIFEKMYFIENSLDSFVIINKTPVLDLSNFEMPSLYYYKYTLRDITRVKKFRNLFMFVYIKYLLNFFPYLINFVEFLENSYFDFTKWFLKNYRIFVRLYFKPFLKFFFFSSINFIWYFLTSISYRFKTFFDFLLGFFKLKK